MIVLNRLVIGAALWLCAALTSAFSQQDSLTFFDYFEEARTACINNTDLWGIDIYCPVLLADPETRMVFSNEADTLGLLRKEGEVFSGVLPDEINIANTAVSWAGKDWAMVVLPLPDNPSGRKGLMCHEMFHRAQGTLGFEMQNPANPHLEKMEGRIYLRLELEALKQAVNAEDRSAMLNHLRDAFIFRNYRRMLYPGSDTTENQLELNEGLAEYTGLVMSGRNDGEAKNFLTSGIESFMKSPGYSRSFAYKTTPAYGYLLRATSRNWNRSITQEGELTRFFIGEFGIQFPPDMHKLVESISASYNGNEILNQERAREESKNSQIAGYRKKYIEDPHLEIPLLNMSFSFDPGNVMPVEDIGTYYPSLRLSDVWGILEVSEGALMSPNFDKVYLTLPKSVILNVAEGDGWKLVMTEGYRIQKSADGLNADLVKK